MRHSIKTDLLQKVLNYLTSKPFNEVNTMINEIVADAFVIETGTDQQTKVEDLAEVQPELELQSE